jgi:hypothetical protein
MAVLVCCFKDDSRPSRSTILDKFLAQRPGELVSEEPSGIHEPAIFIGNEPQSISDISTSKSG